MINAVALGAVPILGVKFIAHVKIEHRYLPPGAATGAAVFNQQFVRVAARYLWISALSVRVACDGVLVYPVLLAAVSYLIDILVRIHSTARVIASWLRLPSASRVISSFINAQVTTGSTEGGMQQCLQLRG